MFDETRWTSFRNSLISISFLVGTIFSDVVIGNFSLVFLMVQKTEAKFLVPEWRDKVESGIGLRSTLA